MSRGITLPGSAKNSGQLKECAKCGPNKEPGGGVQMTRTTWYCANCWLNRLRYKK